MALLPAPVHLGLPERYGSWWENQDRAICAALDSAKRFICISAPTGFGKSVVYVGIALLGGLRAAFLTVTKGLQTQLGTDFASCGIVDVRGQGNYACKELARGGRYQGEGLIAGDLSCASGPCHVGRPCPRRYGGCEPFDKVREAQSKALVTTNYQFFIYQNRYSESLGPFGLLVCDEAHAVQDELASALKIQLNDRKVEETLGCSLPAGEDPEKWKQWAAYTLYRAERRLAELEQEIIECRDIDGAVPQSLLRAVYRVKSIVPSLKTLAAIEGRWIVEREHDGATIAPVWPAPYAERLLFLGIPKVILISATIGPKTPELLGIRPDQFDFFDYPSSFPVHRRPVTHIETVRVRHDWSLAEQKTWVRRIDQIIDRRLDRKGLVHSGSYERQQLILKYSRHAGILMSNNSKSTRKVVEEFKAARPPAVLVSPSMTTGWDLPYEECEFCIISKVPFPDSRGGVIKARTEEDPDYAPYLAMLSLIQAAGRGVRSATDQCEIIVTDDNWRWFWPKYRHYAPNWFKQAVRRSHVVTDPLPKLNNLKKERFHDR